MIIILLISLTGCNISGHKIDCTGNECYDKAVNLEDANYCDKMQGSLKEACLIEIVKLNHDINICEKLDKKDQCMSIIAINRSDVSICKTLENSDFKDDCFNKIAHKKIDFKLCPLIINSHKRSQCKYDIAIQTDFMKCNSILDSILQTRCYNYWAFHEINPRYCRMDAGDSVLRSICFKKVARLSNNQTTCNEINLNVIKQSCLDMFDKKGKLLEKEYSRRDKDLAMYS